MRAAERRMSAVTLAPERLQGAYDAMCRTYAANLRRIRKARGFKRYGAALALGVSASTWGRWESGQRFPSPPLLAGIAMLLQTPIAEFFFPVPPSSDNDVSSV
jgi:transcriptional regulator with XRE-family HTH domain